MKSRTDTLKNRLDTSLINLIQLDTLPTNKGNK
jgi:hypothetical protein